MKTTPMTKEERNDLKAEIRMALFKRGAKQVNGNCFEFSEITSNGSYDTFKYQICQFILQKWFQDINWKRRNKVTKNPVPYKWVPYAEVWLQDIHVARTKRGTLKILGIQKTT